MLLEKTKSKIKMTNCIRFFLGCLIFSLSATAQNMDSDFKKKKVFLFAGQSNMAGRADGKQLSEKDLKRLEKVSDRITFYYNHKPSTGLQLTIPSKYIQNKFDLKKSFGPELFFGIQLAERYPNDEFIFIKRAKGGTSLYGCWNPEWDSKKAELMNELNQPKLFSDFIDYVKSVLNTYEDSEYRIEGMLWVQGETDSGVKKWGEKPANSYGENLQLLIHKTRDLLEVPNMPFVIFQVGNGQVVEGMIKTAENDKNVYLIPQSNDENSKDFYEKNPPPLEHYTAKSMKKIGQEFFKVYEEILTE